MANSQSGCRVNTKPDNASRKLVHDGENPMCSQCCGFAAEQIQAPKTVFRVTDEGKPGGSAAIGRRMLVGGPECAGQHPY
jgi:hypothetical protein